MMNRWISDMKMLVGLCLLLTIFSGCGGTPPDGFRGKRGQVSGAVALDGKPVPKGCQVMFVAPQGNYIATAVTAGDGKYALRYQLSAGLPAADYLVQIGPPAEVSTTPGKPIDPMKLPPANTTATKMTESELDETAVIPPRYTSTATSQLKFTVKPGANTANFELSRKKQ